MFFRRPELFKALFFKMIILPRQLRLKNETRSLLFTWAERQKGFTTLTNVPQLLYLFIYLFIYLFFSLLDEEINILLAFPGFESTHLRPVR